MSKITVNAARLHALMTKRNVSDADLAEAIGISRTAMFYLRTGTTKTTTERKMVMIAKELDTTVDYLSGEGDPEEDTSRVAVVLDEPGRKLAQVAANLSLTRKEELIRIAETLLVMEQEQFRATPSSEAFDVILGIYNELQNHTGGRDIVEALEALLRANGISFVPKRSNGLGNHHQGH
jgi:transcriptional regulator with XRE-family HTH domain